MHACRWLGLAAILLAGPALAGQISIPFVSELAYDQPRVAVYLKDAVGILPHGTEGYTLPGLLDTGAAAHVLPRYLSDALPAPIDPAGEAEILTLCGFTEFLDISHPLTLGVGPYESEDEADFVEVGPHRLAVRIADPPGSELLLMPMIVGTPFLKQYPVYLDWQLIEIWPGIELPQLITTPRPAGQPAPGPIDLTVPLTLLGETSEDISAALPSAWHVPFADLVLRHGEKRERRAFIVDTGAQISFISTELALALGIDLDNPAGAGLPVIGAGTCSLTIYPYLVDRIYLPTAQNVALAFEQPLMYVMDVPGIDGGLGSNMMFFFDELLAVDIDLPSRSLGLKLTVPIPAAGDTTGDGAVNIFDLLNLAAAWNTVFGGPAYDETADVDLTGRVDIFDLLQLADDWGR